MPFQRASEEKLRTRRIVSVGGRFRRAAAASPEPADETSRSTSTGTGQPPYQPTRDQEMVYHSITTNPAYRAKSFEELRLEDYEQGNKGRGGAAPATELGSSPTIGAYARSESASSYLENKIRYLNRQKYDMFNENCQYYSKAVAEECIRDEDRGNLAVV